MIETIITIGVILAIGSYFTWLHIKVKTLGDMVYNFPSVEDLAVAIMNAKIPIKNLPPELQDKLQSMKDGGFGMPPADRAEDLKKTSTYIG